MILQKDLSGARLAADAARHPKHLVDRRPAGHLDDTRLGDRSAHREKDRSGGVIQAE